MSFEEFIKRQSQEAPDKINVSEKIEGFRKLIGDFYGKIDGEWLSEYIGKNLVTSGECPISITEERLGTYQVQSKWLEIAGKRVNIIPVGTALIGTDARFDISYRGNERMIVHVEDEWKLVDCNLRTIYKTVDSTVFQNLLMELMG